jgi:hypothetical protein
VNSELEYVHDYPVLRHFATISCHLSREAEEIPQDFLTTKKYRRKAPPELMLEALSHSATFLVDTRVILLLLLLLLILLLIMRVA